MKFLTLIAIAFFAITATAAVQVNSNTPENLGVHNRIVCGTNVDCTKGADGLTMDLESTLSLTTVTISGDLTASGSITGDGGDELVGYLKNQVAATATTITAAQCGSTFINGGAVQMELPEASTVLGCRLTFIVGNATNFDVNPDDADQILVETDAVGDAMRNATLGNSIVIEAISASQWAPVGTIGTWSDIN